MLVLCFVVQYIVSFLVLQSSQLGERERVALPLLSPRCHVAAIVLCTVQWVGLQCVFLVFSGHTHLRFETLNKWYNKSDFSK